MWFMNDEKDIEGERCVIGKDGKVCFGEKDRKQIWKNHMEHIRNEKNDWDRKAKANIIERPMKGYLRRNGINNISDGTRKGNWTL